MAEACDSLETRDVEPEGDLRVNLGSFRGYTMLDNIANSSSLNQPASMASSVRHNVPPLPHSVQEHLGRMLRADYYELADKPRYLGDPALPLEFDPYLYRLEQKERALRVMRVREQGTQAVAEALAGFSC